MRRRRRGRGGGEGQPGAGCAERDELAEHGVVVGGDDAALDEGVVEAQALRRHEAGDGARLGEEAPLGVFGGDPGEAGSFLVNGEPVETQARITLSGDDVVRLELPGGGGYGAAE